MSPEDFADLVDRALREDLGDRGDITTKSVIPADATAEAVVVVRESGVVAGLSLGEYVFGVVDPTLTVDVLAVEGDRVEAGTVVARVAGPARSMLTAERTALNILGRVSGVATATAAYVDAVEGTGARISDTRKTLPGLRALDKYAVTAGGGINHRMGLYDAVMIKDNHIAAAGDIRRAVDAARAAVGPGVMVEVEVDTLDQLHEALETRADRVLLDNMSVEQLRQAVEVVAGAMVTEASGGVTLDTVRSIAETGVDIVSVGAITHSAPQLDIALDFVA